MESGFNISDTAIGGAATPAYVGSGGTALCYRVNRHGKWLLMKRLKPEYAASERLRQALAKEYEVGANIDHPNIVRYQYFDDTAAEPYLLQDYVDGLTLDQFISQYPDYFSKKAHRRRFLDQLLSAVECLHAHQVLHLDLSPANIIITTRGHDVKLIDLGMAFTDTFTSTSGGTEGYSAPEVMSHDAQITAPADIYSIGRIMALTGCKAAGITGRCVRHDASGRYQSIGQLRRALATRHSRRVWALVAAIIAVVAIVVTAIVLTRPADKSHTPASPTSDMVATEASDTVPADEAQQVIVEGGVARVPGGSVAAPPAVSQSGNTSRADSFLDDYEARRAAYLENLNRQNQKYDADMKEIHRSMVAEKQRIYAGLDKLLAHPDYSSSDLGNTLRNTLHDCHSKLSNKEKQLYKAKGYLSIDVKFADSVQNVYSIRVNQTIVKWREGISARSNATEKQQQLLYSHLVKVVDKAYAPILQLVASPPKSKEKFYQEYLALKEKADDTYAAALGQGYKTYGVTTLTDSQFQQLRAKIANIEQKFYAKYNKK